MESVVDVRWICSSLKRVLFTGQPELKEELVVGKGQSAFEHLVPGRMLDAREGHVSTFPDHGMRSLSIHRPGLVPWRDASGMCPMASGRSALLLEGSEPVEVWDFRRAVGLGLGPLGSTEGRRTEGGAMCRGWPWLFDC